MSDSTALKNAKARVESARDVAAAYRAARDRLALAYEQAERSPFGPVASMAFHRLTAAETQLDAALYTEREAVRALMVLKVTESAREVTC